MAYFGPPKNPKDSNEDAFFPQGQNHDRIASNAGSDEPSVTSSPSNSMALQPDTSISQKMLSAVTGSVLTSLLGTPLTFVLRPAIADNLNSNSA